MSRRTQTEKATMSQQAEQANVQPIPQAAPAQPAMQPQPAPQPVPQPVAPPQPPQLNAVPAIQGVNFYYAIGQGQTGPQLYSFDVNLNQWRIAQQTEIETMLTSMGIPANVLQAMKQFNYRF